MTFSVSCLVGLDLGVNAIKEQWLGQLNLRFEALALLDYHAGMRV